MLNNTCAVVGLVARLVVVKPKTKHPRNGKRERQEQGIGKRELSDRKTADYVALAALQCFLAASMTGKI